MWTEEQRRICRREGDGYPSDLRNTEWARLELLIPSARPGGRPRKTDMRAAMNAILYLLRTACPWRYLPRDGFPPRSTVYNVKRSGDIKGFVVLPRRWVVERTFSWFGRNRRLAKDFENLAETLATFVTLASIQLALRRLARA
jgi:transposase